MDSGIPRGTSFTDLIEDSFNDYMSGSSHISDEDSVLQAQTFSQMSPPQVESTTKKSQRGINFSIEEDILLVSAFLNVNQDVVKSNNQKRETYWMRIWEYYHKWKTFTSERTAGSLMNRWSTIQLSTNKFCGFLSQIESKNESGKTEEDKLDAARNLYNTIQGTKFQFEHCWNLLKHSPKWLVTVNNQQPKKRKKMRFEASSPSNLEFEHLEDDDALQVPIVNLERPNLERPPGVKAEKERLKKQKCKEGTTSHIEDVLNAMMEEKRKMNEMKMACIEKGRLADHEQEMARIFLEDKKLETKKMKIELAMKNLEEVNVMEKMRLDKLKEDKEMEKIRLDKLKEDNEMEKIRMKQVKEETEIMDGCKYTVFSAARIYSLVPNGDP